jgi:hypothetical protein
MSVGVNVTCELRWLSSVISESDREFIRSKSVAINSMVDALQDLYRELYSIPAVPVVAHYVPLHETYCRVWARAQDVVSGWSEREGVYPYIVEKATYVDYLGKLVKQLDDAVNDGKSPWSREEPHCDRVSKEIAVVEAHLQGLRWVLSSLLGYYAY